jgi:DNA-directed RNA polymerase subunit beta'
MRTFHTGGVAGTDITHGLPRIEEIFEARLPKGKAFVAEEDGVVEEIEDKGLLKVLKVKTTIESDKKKKDKIYEFPIHQQSEIFFKKGDKVFKGDQLCEGRLDIKEVFQIKGRHEVERYIINEIQNIYSSEGAAISDKHIEVVVRQMFSRVQVKTAGSTSFIQGDVVEKSKFIEVNREIKEKGGEPAKAKQLLFGITKVALSTESFLSAASFIETAKVLINAAIEGKEDILRGLKENVIIGRLIPVGTGLRTGVEAEEEEVVEKKESKKS